MYTVNTKKCGHKSWEKQRHDLDKLPVRHQQCLTTDIFKKFVKKQTHEIKKRAFSYYELFLQWSWVNHFQKWGKVDKFFF